LKLSEVDLAQMTLLNFFDTMKEVSILGLKVELLNERTLGSEVFTFLPSLSSIYLAYATHLKPPKQRKAEMGSDSGLIKSSPPRRSLESAP